MNEWCAVPNPSRAALKSTVFNTEILLSLSPPLQASLQNVKQRSTHWFQLFVVHQDGTVEPRLPDGQHQPPQPRWLLRRQRELQFHHEWPSERAGLASPLPLGPGARRQRAGQETLRWLLQHHRRRLADQVRIHAQLHAQETVFGVRWHCIRVPLWSGLLRGLQGFLQEDNSRLVGC